MTIFLPMVQPVSSKLYAISKAAIFGSASCGWYEFWSRARSDVAKRHHQENQNFLNHGLIALTPN